MPKEIDCPDCGGDGFTAEHASDCNGSCDYCPVQVQCEICECTGKIKVYTEKEVQKLIRQKKEECALICEKVGYTTIEHVTARMDKNEAIKLKNSKKMWLSTQCAEAIRNMEE